MRRRRALLPLAAAMTAVLLAGCVRQPFDEAQFEAAEDVGGVAAAPLGQRQAKRAAQKAKQARAIDVKRGRATDKARDGRGDRGRQPAPADGGQSPDAATSGDRGSSRDADQDASRDGGDTAGDGRGAGTGQARDSGEEDAAPAARPFRVVGTAADPKGDPSGEAPAYGDIRQLLVESNGARARVTVAVAAPLPGALGDGEVMGFGIDFYRSDDRESDYQLFVDGGSDGWEAFLHTPAGVERYPGSFSMGGRVMVFQLPWSALGGAKPADVNMFVDWSQERTLLNAVGNDRAPDDGRIRVNPR